MDMLPQHILTRQHTPTLRSIGLRMYSRHTVTAAESALGLETVTTGGTEATTAVIVVTMVEISAVTVAVTVAVMAAVTVAVMAAVTVAVMAAIIEMMKDQQFIPAS